MNMQTVFDLGILSADEMRACQTLDGADQVRRAHEGDASGWAALHCARACAHLLRGARAAAREEYDAAAKAAQWDRYLAHGGPRPWS